MPTPPTRLAVQDTPGTVGEGNTELAFGGGFAGAGWDGSATYATVSVVHGIVDGTDLHVDATAGGIVVDDQYVDEISAFGMARFGIEQNLVRRVLSVIAGVGGGRTRAGNFASADAGLLLGYENRYVSPFVGAVLHLGTPLSTPSVRIDRHEDDGSISTRYREAYRSIGWVGSAGLRIPFGGHRLHEPHRFALQFSIDGGSSHGKDPSDDTTSWRSVSYVGLSGTFRVLLGAPRDP